MIKLPIASIQFGADSVESESIYITCTGELSYSVSSVIGQAATYSLEKKGQGYILKADANEWQDESAGDYVDTVTLFDNDSRAVLTVTTLSAPTGSIQFREDYVEVGYNSVVKRVYFDVVSPSGTTIKVDTNNALVFSSVTVSELQATTADSVYTGYVDITSRANDFGYRFGYLWLTIDDTQGHSMRRDLFTLQTGRIVFPCWREATYTLQTPEGYREYTLVNSDTNQTIYKGRVTSTSSAVTIDTARIIRPLLYSSYDLEISDAFVKDENAYLNYHLVLENNPVQYYTTYDNYNYLRGQADNTNMILNDLIVNRYCNYQPYIISVLSTDGEQCIINGEKMENEEGVWHYGVDGQEGEITASIGNSKLVLTPTEWCGRYIIFYVNAKGGIDWLHTEGTDTISDTITNNQINRPYYNEGNTFGKSTYLRNITRKITLHTDWLTDEQSLKMYNLLESPRVWLFDFEDDRIYPCNIADTSMTYKTFENQGRQLVSYDLNLEYSHTYERR